jgi:outer membrane protein assembly factor BamD
MSIRRGLRKYQILYTLSLVYLLVTGCSVVTIDNDSPPEEQYAEGERLLSKDRYLEAVERFRILKSRYPYSKYAALATLRIGDTHFQEEAFLESASAYKIFRELYPRHEKAPYALFRTGESFYNLLPSSEDRDLEPAQDAIYSYTQLLREFPGSEFEEQAKKRVGELRGRLAAKEEYVGDYYFKRELYSAAASRYDYLFTNFPDVPRKEQDLFNLAYSYERMGEFRKAEESLASLDADFPGGKDQLARKSLRDKVQAGLDAPAKE